MVVDVESPIAADATTHLLRALQRDLDRGRAVQRGDQHVVETDALLQTIAGISRVLCRPFEIIDRSERVAGPEPELAGEPESSAQPTFVAEFLEDEERVGELASDPVVRRGRVGEQTQVRERDRGIRRPQAVAHAFADPNCL